MLSIIVADPHAIVRTGLRHIIEQATDMTVVGEAESGNQLIDMLHAQACDLLVLEPNLPGSGSTDLIRQIRMARPAMPTLVLSTTYETGFASSVLRAGASGFVGKDKDPEMFLLAIRKLAKGESFIDPGLVDQIVFDAGLSDGQAPHMKLSGREEQVFQMLVAGLSSSDISGQLALSIKTVSTYKTRVMQKLNARSLVDLVRYARSQGMTAG